MFTIHYQSITYKQACTKPVCIAIQMDTAGGVDWQAKRLEGKDFTVWTGALFLFGQLAYICIDKS